MKYTLEEMRKCVARELAMRCSAYPKCIEKGSMKTETANYEIDVMRQIDTLLRTFTEPEVNAKMVNEDYPFYQAFVAAYSDFIKSRGGGAILFNAREGKTIKEIYAKLKTSCQAKTDEGALQSWQYIFKNWATLNEFLQTQITLTQINKNLLEILDKLRNGSKKYNGKGASINISPSSLQSGGKLWDE